ncbi:uncharacterized protein L969DRAFT_92775 [Mixia osmundae IAM 14324]|uniref:Cytochrome c oxidase subunit IV n=1 Tax=Mixia osmundae (strain CBS 9802 / IAM 14324 / JCM 22182 / KY 12970) TaxID=764103 RepID=G7DYI6_MIXOS|nr:uncharacterized protein L969DRAFT_92775 [Mixia osmundae IAM 14324]KEI41547.1 hypothetical protein L969DRAFT_92775 [Mixia osmundae IAM 14324]GAA95646.1 hypothetical protein E5Q_02302 [Mixia osmundae IAM 14324]
MLARALQRQVGLLRPTATLSAQLRSGYATAAATTSANNFAAPQTAADLPKLGNIEASWAGLTPTEQKGLSSHLEELQRKDWKELSLEQKKAIYYVAFGPHGPRAPVDAPGAGAKIFVSVVVTIAAAVSVFWLVRSRAPAPVKTMTKEWQEAATDRAVEQKMDPFTGATSEKKRSMVQS